MREWIPAFAGMTGGWFASDAGYFVRTTSRILVSLVISKTL